MCGIPTIDTVSILVIFYFVEFRVKFPFGCSCNDCTHICYLDILKHPRSLLCFVSGIQYIQIELSGFGCIQGLLKNVNQDLACSWALNI